MVTKGRAKSTRLFYVALVVVAVAGGALIALSASRNRQTSRASTIQVTAAQAEGYLLGKPDAPVQIMEFADFECPACGQFALITEPDVRSRLVASGQASYRFFDFPLPVHRNSIPASNAAACAADQGKFWEMHDKLFYGQPDWNTEATSNPRKVFSRYAQELGLDMGQWNGCMEAEKHLERIMANEKEGERRQVQSTPTFVIGNKMIAGALPFDQIKAYVDSAAMLAQASRSDSAATKPH